MNMKKMQDLYKGKVSSDENEEIEENESAEVPQFIKSKTLPIDDENTDNTE
jgi:hypothetical protein